MHMAWRHFSSVYMPKIEHPRFIYIHEEFWVFSILRLERDGSQIN